MTLPHRASAHHHSEHHKSLSALFNPSSKIRGERKPTYHYSIRIYPYHFFSFQNTVYITLCEIPLATMGLISESIETVKYHYKHGNLNWPMIIYISLAHVAAVIGLFTISKCHPYTLFWTFLLWPISGIGITGGVHRLWAHRSYKAALPMRIYLMLANSIANQGSIWHWSRDHRVHHKHSEVSVPIHF
jgi:hypothetical protein